MSEIVIAGNTSGSVTIAAPDVAGTTTLTLPASSGTVLDDASVGVCRAWVNFNGTGTVAIRAAFNVSSITDNSVGNYTVNFTNSMVDSSYAINYTAGGTGYIGGIYSSTPPTTSSVRVLTVNTAAVGDSTYSNISVFR